MSIVRIVVTSTIVFAVATSVVDPRCFGQGLPKGKFTDVKPVEGIELDSEDTPVISANGLELFFDRSVGVPSDLWVATRSNQNEPFQNIAKVENVNSTSDDDPGSISLDGLTLYFSSNRSGAGSFNMYRATRSDLQSPFGNVTSLGDAVNPGGYPFVSKDGQALYFQRTVSGTVNRRLWTASWDSVDSSFVGAFDLGDTINGSPTLDSWRPSVSADGLTLFFADGFFAEPRPGGTGDIWVAHRSDPSGEFGEPINLNDAWPGSDINTDSALENQAYISPDWPEAGSKLYFTVWSEEAPGGDIWEATWVPEPSTFTLFVLAFAFYGLGAWQRR